MSTDRLQLYAIAPTQFATGGALDVGAIASNVERIRDHGIDQVLLTGAYGEFQSLDDDERVEITRAVVATGAARSVMVGAAHPSTDATVRLARRLFEAGADQVMVAPPLVAELTPSDVERHFDVLAAALGSRLVVYNNPIFGRDLDAAELGRLAATGAYEAIKQGTTQLGQVTASLRAVRETGRDVKLLAAADLSSVATLAAGFDGLTSTNCWVFPDAFTDLVGAAEKGDLERMRQIVDALGPYAAFVRATGQPRTVKAAMQMRGYAGSPFVRLPYAELTESETRALEAAVRATDGRLSSLDH